jgi:hypothetical protein
MFYRSFFWKAPHGHAFGLLGAAGMFYVGWVSLAGGVWPFSFKLT